ncbi:MAG: tol-pal system protein YbgF [Sandaracinaceae bacterium]
MKVYLGIALLLALSGVLTGCATAGAGHPSNPADVRAEAQAQELREARAARDESSRRVRELETQLALSRSEARELREQVALVREAQAREVTRIRSEARRAPEEAEPVETAVEDGGPRPVLRLYGPEPRPAYSTSGLSALPGPLAPSVVGPPPAGGIRLPMMSGADAEAGVPAIPLAPVAVMDGAPVPTASIQPPIVAAPLVDPRRHDAATEEYRVALRALSEQRLDEAASRLETFVRQHGEHPYADNAMYWRAEIFFTQRDFARALRAFTNLIERYPRGNKVPDALLRIGLTYERLGRRAQARRVFERLRAQYPDTMAARMAAREDA